MNDELTFGDFIQPFFSIECPRLKRKKRGGRNYSPRYIAEQRRLLMCFIMKDEMLCINPVNNLKRTDIDRFIDRLIEEQGFCKTSQAVVALLKLLLKELYIFDYIEKDLTKAITPIYYEERERGILTIPEIKEYLKSTHYESLLERTFFTLAFECGLRRGEILALKWSDVDFETKQISINRAWKNRVELGPPKNGKARVSWLPQLSEQLLLQYRNTKFYTDGFIFPGIKNELRLGETWVRNHFIKIMQRMDIDYKKRNICFHSLRHSLKSYLESCGLSAEFQKMLFGWSGLSAESMSRRYTHLDVTTLQERLSACSLL
jgi:integrase